MADRPAHADVRAAWAYVDPLGEALHSLRMRGTFYCRSELTAPWGIAVPAMPDCLMFHVVTKGRCWLEVDGATLHLQHGDLAIVLRGEGHLLMSEPGTPTRDVFELPREQISQRYEILQHGGGGAATSVVCGAVRFDDPAAHRLVRLLPPIMHVDGSDPRRSDGVEATLRWMAAEARELRPGGEAVITRLADILVIQAIRSWIEEDPAAKTGWLGALADQQIGRAIALIHRDPARAWTLVSLAAEVGMSRSAFAARFTELVGEPAMQYVARWRMHVAETWLKEDNASLAELASRLGYQSEATFSRAFKRLMGISPGAARRSA